MEQAAGVDVRDTESRFREMYETTLPIVYGFLSIRVGGDRALAEDLTAETYTAAVAHFNSGREAEVTASWLRTVARRRLIDHWRHQSVAASKVIQLAHRSRTDPFSDPARDAVIAALATLQPDQRAALVLQHVESHSVAEVAEIIGRTEKATESLLSRARTAFRASYAEVTGD